METLVKKHTCTTMFTAAFFITAKVQKQLKCPSTDEWIKKKWYIYTPQNITQPLKKQGILPFPTPVMNLKGIMLREISQSKINTLCYHLYVESKT